MDRKLKHTLQTFERMNVKESNVEYVLRHGVVKPSCAEALTEGTKASRILQIWLATPRPSDAEQA